jgi:hypothetical protein
MRLRFDCNEACRGETTAISLNDVSISRRHFFPSGRKRDFGKQRYCHCCQFPQSLKRARIIVFVSRELDIQKTRGASLFQEISWRLSAVDVKGRIGALPVKRVQIET